jgi:hypothetical protein
MGLGLLGDRFVCTCLDFEDRKIDACKHIHMQLSYRLLSGHNYKMSQSLQSLQMMLFHALDGRYLEAFS